MCTGSEVCIKSESANLIHVGYVYKVRKCQSNSRRVRIMSDLSTQGMHYV